MFPHAYVRKSSLNELRSRMSWIQLPLEVALSDLNNFVNEKKRLCLDLERGEAYEDDCEDPFVEIMYNVVPGLVVDLVEKRTATDLAIELGNEVLYLERGTELEIVEASGKRVCPLIKEGDGVEEGQRIFYIVTGKLEVRVVRSKTRGVAIYVGEVVPSELQRYVAVIVDGSRIRKLVKRTQPRSS